MGGLREMMAEYVTRHTAPSATPAGMAGLIRVRQRPEPVKCNVWEQLESPQRLRCRYTLPDRSMVLPFLEMVMEYEDQVQHHGSITIEDCDVTIEVRTHDLETLTARDRQYASQVDLIRIDLDRGWSDYVHEPASSDYSDLAETLRDRLNVGYTDEEEGYEF